MQSKRLLARSAALLLSLSLVAAGCGDDSDDNASDSGDSTETTAAPSSDGPTLVGMRGTTPLGAQTPEFQEALLGIDPELIDFNYASEAYDAVVIVALASEAAKTDGIDMAKQINAVTRGGEECDSFESCKALLDAGTADIDYKTVSTQDDFSGNGQPTKASYGVLEFGTEGIYCEKKGLTACVDDSKTEYVNVEVPPTEDVPEEAVEGTRAGDGVLKIGTLLPQTGSLSYLGPPEFAGVKLAIKEINEAGGVLGKPVEYVEGDSGDTENKVAPTTVNTLLAANVDAIIGAASSSVTLSVIDTVTTAGVVMFSPANTSTKLSNYADKGLYFRTAPADILQGSVLADAMVKAGSTKVYVLALNDDYGTGLSKDLQKGLESGGVEVAGESIYDPKAADYSTEVQAAKDSGADAIALIGFDESSKILAKMAEQGIDLTTVWGVDGNMGNALAQNFEAGK